MRVLRDKIAQMLIIGFPGCVLDEKHPVIEWLARDPLGGVLLFDVDFETKKSGKNLKDCEQIRAMTRQLRAASEAYPLFIAIDYEGGAVDRLRHVPGCMKTMTPAAMALLSDVDLYEEASRMAATLKTLGCNLNFAPLVDLHLNADQGIIGRLERSFSTDPEHVIRAASVFVNAFHNHGIVCSYKHFPGHGSALGDTHEGFVDVTNTYQASELVPYEVLLNDKTLPEAMIMTAHVIHRPFDDSGLPATLSYPMITGLLRERIGFDGVVISDDLQMQAISDHYDIDEALALTINAGADMVIFGNQLGWITATEVIDRIERLVLSGAIPRSRIEAAYQRIVRLKSGIQ